MLMPQTQKDHCQRDLGHKTISKNDSDKPIDFFAYDDDTEDYAWRDQSARDKSWPLDCRNDKLKTIRIIKKELIEIKAVQDKGQ